MKKQIGRSLVVGLLSLLGSFATRGQCSNYTSNPQQGRLATCVAGARIAAGWIVSLNSSAQVVPIPAGSTSGAFGIALQSAGKAGATVQILLSGNAPLSVDNNCAIGNSVAISPTLNGNGDCVAAAGSAQVIGVATSSSPGGAGSINVQLLLPGSASGGGACLSWQQCANTTVQNAMTAAGANGLAAVPSTYAGVDIPAGTRINSLTSPSSSSQPSGLQGDDHRFGTHSHFFFNPGTDGLIGNVQVADQTDCNWTIVVAGPPANPFCHLTVLNAFDGGVNNNGIKTNWGGNLTYLFGYAQGQHIATGADAEGNGAGDNIDFSFFSNCRGGSNAATDEGCHLGDLSVSQGGTAAAGTIASGASTGATSLVLSYSAGQGTQGAKRPFLDTTQATTTGLVTTITGSGPLTYTFSGVTFTPDTITTDSIPITTPGNQPITTVGATTGITANATLVCIFDQATSECFIPTAVAANSLTATFLYPHATGARIAWGPQAGKYIELNADRWTTNGQYGYTPVTNTIRQAWRVIGCPTATTCLVQNSIAGSYAGVYSGMATMSVGSNAYTMYPGADIVSVQSGGTVSNIITLEPNNVGWANTDAFEIPFGPGQKQSLWNAVINRFMPSSSIAPTGGMSFTANGRFCCQDIFAGFTFNPNSVTDYAGHGGQMLAPAYAYYAGGGPLRYGYALQYAPDVAVFSAGCPIAGCSTNNWFTSFPLLMGSNVGNGFDAITHNSALAQFGIYQNGGNVNLRFPQIEGAAAVTGGAADFQIETGYVSCTQANCANGSGNATTLYTIPNVSNVQITPRVSGGCTSAVSSATAAITIRYTDQSGTAQTQVSNTITCTTIATGQPINFSSNLTPFTAKQNTSVQYYVTTTNSPNYQARVIFVQDSTN